MNGGDDARSGRRLLRSGLGVGVAATLASGANYLSNVALGRALDPGEFADAALVVSGLLLLSALALGFQLTVARAVAAGDHPFVGRAQRAALAVGAVLAVVIAGGAPVLAGVVNMSSPVPLMVLGLGVPVYLPMAVGRGVAQATHAFGRLGGSIAIEALARLIVTVAAVAVGLGATGAAIALVASFAAAWVPCARIRTAAVDAPPTAPNSTSVIAATVLLLAGQVVISNGDLWVVAAVLPDDAGVYAAVALIGRLVFIAAWSVVTVVFPSLVAGGHSAEDVADLRLLGRALVLTAAFGLVLTAGSAVFGEALIVAMVGDDYAAGATLLWPYALATTLFVCANLCAVADVAAGRLALPALVAVGSVAQTAVLVGGADAGVAWVVWAQVAVMAGLFGTTAGALVGRELAPAVGRLRSRYGRSGALRRA